MKENQILFFEILKYAKPLDLKKCEIKKNIQNQHETHIVLFQSNIILTINILEHFISPRQYVKRYY